MTTQDREKIMELEKKEYYLKEGIEYIIGKLKNLNAELTDELKGDAKYNIDPLDVISAYKQGQSLIKKYMISINELNIEYLEDTLKQVGDM